jgi:membrane-associated protease RseP (regulator of RpoE activity)
MIDLYLLSVIIFFGILAVLIIRDRENIDFNYFLLMKRTKRFRNVLDKIAKKSILFWKIVGTIAFLVVLYYMISGVYLILNVAYLVYTGVVTQPAASLVIPFPSSQTTVGPGFIGIPFWFWIIVIAVILIPHESLHGIVARAEGIKLKDVGLMLLLLQFISIPVVIIYFIYTKTFDITIFLASILFSIPGAFVEPDEKQIKKSKFMTKLRIFSSGSFINIVIGLLVMLLVQNLIWSSNFNGIMITSVNETSPAASLGLKPGMILESINGKELKMGFDEYSFLVLTISKSNTENITKTMSNLILFKNLGTYKPGDTIKLKVNGMDYDLKLGEHPDIKGFPYIGIGSKVNARDAGLFLVVFPLLGMISSISMFVGIFNILPIYPLDGGLIVKAVAEKYAKKRSNNITIAITAIMVIIILYIVFGVYV